MTSIKPGELWPDENGAHINAHGGGILFHRGRYYWFGEHKIAGRGGNRAQVGVHCYSSKDLLTWKDEGIALPVSEDPASPIVKGCILERPKVVFCAKTKRFVMWFHLELKGKGYGAAMCGVTEAEKATGPFRFIDAFRPDKGVWPIGVTDGASVPENRYLVRDFERGQMARDMTLFVDDDAKAYLIAASEENQTIHVSELTDDYLRPSGRFQRAFVGRAMEAPAVFKHEGKYYFIGSGCTGWAPNAARSAVADSIWGPWQELGNPWRGPKEQTEISFDTQSTYVLPVQGKPGKFIFMADRWRPKNPIDGRYVWLPIRFEHGAPVLHWIDEWIFSQL